MTRGPCLPVRCHLEPRHFPFEYLPVSWFLANLSYVGSKDSFFTLNLSKTENQVLTPHALLSSHFLNKSIQMCSSPETVTFRMLWCVELFLDLVRSRRSTLMPKVFDCGHYNIAIQIKRTSEWHSLDSSKIGSTTYELGNPPVPLFFLKSEVQGTGRGNHSSSGAFL